MAASHIGSRAKTSGGPPLGPYYSPPKPTPTLLTHPENPSNPKTHPSHYMAAPRSQSRGTPTPVIDSHEQPTACVSYTTYPGYNSQPHWQPATLAAVERPLADLPSGHTTHSQNPPQHYSLTPKIHPSHYTAAPRSQSRGTPTPVIDSHEQPTACELYYLSRVQPWKDLWWTPSGHTTHPHNLPRPIIPNESFGIFNEGLVEVVVFVTARHPEQPPQPPASWVREAIACASSQG